MKKVNCSGTQVLMPSGRNNRSSKCYTMHNILNIHILIMLMKPLKVEQHCPRLIIGGLMLVGILNMIVLRASLDSQQWTFVRIYILFHPNLYPISYRRALSNARNIKG